MASSEITLCDGKYKVILHDDFRFEALRYEQPWRDMTGDGMIFAMFTLIKELENENMGLKGQIHELLARQ